MALFGDDRRIRPSKRGGFDIRLPDAERELLASLPGELVELLDASVGDPDAIANDPALARLFPDAYTAIDADLAAEYRRLMTEDLRERHRASLETMAAGANADRIDADELYAWMTALGQLRLVIGTRIGVTEDLQAEGFPEDHPAAEAFALYSYLSWLQEQAVEALSATL
ncbi:MAG: hypothetical protein QOF21_719 [Actinomycetota bacterium]|jgi:hypothetical protein